MVKSRIVVGAVTACVAAAVVGGVAWAVTIVPPVSTDRYYACVSPAGVVRAGTIRFNTPPTKCPNAADVVRTWTGIDPTAPVMTVPCSYDHEMKGRRSEVK